MYCRNCGKPISSIVNECPYCKTKVIDDNNEKINYQQQKNNNVFIMV